MSSTISIEKLKSIKSRAHNIIRKAERLEQTDLNYDTELFSITESIKWITFEVEEIKKDQGSK